MPAARLAAVSRVEAMTCFPSLGFQELCAEPDRSTSRERDAVRTAALLEEDLLIEGTNRQGAVVAPEAEAVGKGAPDSRFPRAVGNVIQVAGRVGRVVVDGRVHDPVADRQGGGNQLNA